ncbi:MAG: diguanylate cyclase [Caldithrix sp.]|nr:diguanylate cyclase [Caldithrix sp.]
MTFKNQLPQKVLLHKSEHPQRNQIIQILAKQNVSSVELQYFSRLTNLNQLDDIPVAIALADQNLQSINFLRTVMQYDNLIQRILISDRLDQTLFLRAINKAHINYYISLPLEENNFYRILSKARRRYENLIRPINRFEALSEVTEDLLSDNERLNVDARTDGLTKLFNRRAFDEYMSKLWQQYSTNQEPFNLSMLDIDHFKTINDTYGHDAGDYVLKQLADILTNDLRAATDRIFRYGGEEFAIITVNTSLEQIQKVMQRILTKIKKTDMRYKHHTFNITFSVGICASFSVQTSQELLISADKALYSAKQNGRSRVEVHAS